MPNSTMEKPRIIRVEETHSTNSLLRDWLERESLPNCSVIVADFQTAGRGQVGNVWESEKGKNLTFSLVLYPQTLPVKQQFLISQIAALSVKETLDAYTEGISIKWPNDIYWQDKKICGMLIENDLAGHNLLRSIIGIGINLNQTVFRGDAPNPVSLWQILRQEVDPEVVLRQFLSRFEAYNQILLAGEKALIHVRYMEALYRREGYHSYTDAQGGFSAQIYGIEPIGHLLLQDTEGTIRRYAFKEVSYCLPGGC
ncbi:MAG: biotin--[acetyl-CoA-carboxylase] ligase [Parabacteroides sp.]